MQCHCTVRFYCRHNSSIKKTGRVSVGLLFTLTRLIFGRLISSRSWFLQMQILTYFPWIAFKDLFWLVVVLPKFLVDTFFEFANANCIVLLKRGGNKDSPLFSHIGLNFELLFFTNSHILLFWILHYSKSRFSLQKKKNDFLISAVVLNPSYEKRSIILF